MFVSMIIRLIGLIIVCISSCAPRQYFITLHMFFIYYYHRRFSSLQYYTLIYHFFFCKLFYLLFCCFLCRCRCRALHYLNQFVCAIYKCISFAKQKKIFFSPVLWVILSKYIYEIVIQGLNAWNKQNTKFLFENWYPWTIPSCSQTWHVKCISLGIRTCMRYRAKRNGRGGEQVPRNFVTAQRVLLLSHMRLTGISQNIFAVWTGILPKRSPAVVDATYCTRVVKGSNDSARCVYNWRLGIIEGYCLNRRF